MQYIVLDLEWNQPLNYQNRVYREVGDRLIFEIIQFGAVKLNEQLEIVDSLSLPVQPTHYVRIHPRIERMTGLGEEELAEAPHFAEAMERFTEWCGEDYALLTWGCDDVSVLQQNLDFFDVHPQLPPLCDIQHLFSDEHETKNRYGLSAAMELLQIDPEENTSFHNALNDAYYTALVFQCMAHPEQVMNYAQQPRQLIHEQYRDSRQGTLYATIAEALQSEKAQKPHCAVCGKPCALEDGGYVPQTADKYIGLARCKAHGELLVRLRFRVVQGDRRWMAVSTTRASRSNVAYVHAKQYQVAQRLEQGTQPNAEWALMNADRSSVPFEE